MHMPRSQLHAPLLVRFSQCVRAQHAVDLNINRCQAHVHGSQKAELRRATRNRRRETSRWLSSFVGGDPDVFVAVSADKKEARAGL
jgi:hypothetical protein